MMNRTDCKAWLIRNGYSVPPKSSCVFCPYRANEQWRDLRASDPAGFARACEIDDRLRTQEGLAMFRAPTFVHRSRVPLRVADLQESDTLDLFNNECEGMCGV
jgi:hypothetical protein